MKKALPLMWRLINERYNLVGSLCQTCNTQYFPSRRVCPKCRRKGKLVPQNMPREGEIYSFTQVHAAPAGFEYETPYFMAIIQLSNGVRVLSQIVDSPAEKVKLGAKAVMVFRKIFAGDDEDAIAYGFKFKIV
jgi:uncharacterized OB-fold protein